MAEKSSKRRKKNEPVDTNELAFDIVQDLTSEEPREVPQEKNSAAIEHGRLGGLKGGKARARGVPAEKRSQIARKAVQTRWANTKD